MTMSAPGSPTAAERRRHWALTGRTLAIGGAGAGLFWAIGLPLPWLLGSAVSVGIAARRLATPLAAPIRLSGHALLGVMIGSAVTPDTARHITALPLVALGLATSTMAAMAAGYALYRYGARWDRRTAFLASAPGALAFLLAVGENAGAHMGRVMLAQGLRLIVLLLGFPLVFAGVAQSGSPPPVWTPTDALVSLLVAAGAGAILHVAKGPAPFLVGPALAAALVGATGITQGGPPPWLFNAALVVIGASSAAGMGARTGLRLGRDVGVAIAGVAVTLAAAAGVAWITAQLSTLAFPALALAYAPGAFEVMVALAAALALEPALVGAAHVTRVLALTVILPMAFKRLPDDPAPPRPND